MHAQRLRHSCDDVNYRLFIGEQQAGRGVLSRCIGLKTETIQVTRKFALGVAAVVIGLALAAMFLIGMIAGGNGGGGPRAEMDPTPSVLAAEDETETPTAVVQIAKQDVETETFCQAPNRVENGVLNVPDKISEIYPPGHWGCQIHALGKLRRQSLSLGRN